MKNTVYFNSNSPASITSARSHKRKIYKDDLELFIKKYEKSMNKILNFFRGIPSEIYFLKLIVGKYKHFQGERIAISDNDMELLNCMITMNKEHRSEKPNSNKRLRDVIVDRMIAYFDLEQEIPSRYISLRDYF